MEWNNVVCQLVKNISKTWLNLKCFVPFMKYELIFFKMAAATTSLSDPDVDAIEY